MAVDPETGSWVRAGIGWVAGVFAGGATIIAVFFRALAGVRREAEEGDKAIWKAVNNADRDDADRRVDNERHFATKDDLGVMEARLNRRLDEHEARARAAINAGLQQIQVMIANRGPVTARGAGE